VTPLERPKELAGKEFYTEAELQALAKQERERLAQVEDEGQPPANHSGVEGAPATTFITISPSSGWTGARLSSPGTGERQSLWDRRGRFLP